jgi:hypothetical protein
MYYRPVLSSERAPQNEEQGEIKEKVKSSRGHKGVTDTKTERQS